MFSCTKVTHLVGKNVGVVLGIFSPQNGRHVDMSPRHVGADTDNVGNIEPCWLLRCHVDVVSARINCDLSALCDTSIIHVKKKNIVVRTSIV